MKISITSPKLEILFHEVIEICQSQTIQAEAASKKRNFSAQKGFYIALVVLTTAIGIYAVLSALTTLDRVFEKNTFDEQAWNDSQAEIQARNEVEDLNGDDDQKGFERVDSIR